MISQMPWGGERVNTIRNKWPERPQHILNYSRIDGHASWAFLPKNKPNLGEVTIFFLGLTTHPMFGISVSPPPCHQLISLNHGPFTKWSPRVWRIRQEFVECCKSSLVQWQFSSIVRQRLGENIIAFALVPPHAGVGKRWASISSLKFSLTSSSIRRENAKPATSRSRRSLSCGI